MSFSNELPSKRLRYDKDDDYDSDSDEDVRARTSQISDADVWPRFLLLESTVDTKPLSKISPFVVNKWIKGISSSGFANTKKIRSGAILVECSTKRASDKLKSQRDPQILDIPIKISNHPTLNSSKGVIKCPELKGLSEADIKEELIGEGVLAVHRVKITRERETIETNTLFLTFATPSPPKSIKIGYLRVTVAPFIPSPLRCYGCQGFGHSSKTCNKPKICKNCGEDEHDEDCTLPPKCANCKGNHPASSKKCPTWITESEIQKVKTERKCSFSEARQRVTGNPLSKDANSYAAKVSSAPSSQSSATSDSLPEMMKVMKNFMKIMSDRLQALEDLVRALIQRESYPSSSSDKTDSETQKESAPPSQASNLESTQTADSAKKENQNPPSDSASAKESTRESSIQSNSKTDSSQGDVSHSLPHLSRSKPSSKKPSFGQDNFKLRHGGGSGNKPPTESNSSSDWRSNKSKGPRHRSPGSGGSRDISRGRRGKKPPERSDFMDCSSSNIFEALLPENDDMTD